MTQPDKESLLFWKQYRPKLVFDPLFANTIVIYQDKNIGDLLLITPVLEVLKKQTRALIFVVTKRGYAELIEDDAGRVRVVDRRCGGFLAAIRQALELRQQAPSVFIDLHGCFASSVTSFIVRAPLSVRMAQLKDRLTDYFHLKVPMRPGTRRHRIDQHLDVLRAVGLDVDLKYRKIYIECRHSNGVMFDDIRERLLLPERYVVIHPGSRWLFKTPQPSFWVSFIDNLIHLGLTPVLTGSADGREGELLAYLHNETGVLNLGGKTSLSELVHVINGSSGYVGVDTFASHVASACEVSGVVIFGPSDEASWGPLNEKLTVVVNSQFKCRPCSLDGCAGSKRSDCLISLDPVHLANYANRILREIV